MRCARIGAVVATAVVAVLSVVPQAQAAPTVEYVNLGDSFSAGNGVLPLAAGAPLECLQSQGNFARLVAADRGYHLTDVSCGGAATKDFYKAQHPDTKPQLNALSPSTNVVTLMIGGNDGNVFASSIVSCLTATLTHPGASSPCKDQYGSKFTDAITSTTGPAIAAALRDIHGRAPSARVFIAGYPWLLPQTGSCIPQMPVASGDVPYVRELQTTLNSVARSAAQATGTTFVDLSVASEGHDACQPVGTRWVEPLIFSQQFVPVHPNALGEAAIAKQVLAAMSVG